MTKIETIRTPIAKTSYINLDAECFDEIFIIYKGQTYKVNKFLLMYYLKNLGLINLQAGDDEDENS